MVQPLSQTRRVILVSLDGTLILERQTVQHLLQIKQSRLLITIQQTWWKVYAGVTGTQNIMTGIPFTGGDSEVFIGLLEDGTEDNDQGEDKIIQPD